MNLLKMKISLSNNAWSAKTLWFWISPSMKVLIKVLYQPMKPIEQKSRIPKKLTTKIKGSLKNVLRECSFLILKRWKRKINSHLTKCLTIKIILWATLFKCNFKTWDKLIDLNILNYLIIHSKIQLNMKNNKIKHI